MDYHFRFNFGLATCVKIYLFWNFLMYVNGQNLAEFRFGTKDSNGRNLYDSRSEFIHNARLGEKKSVVEPYHEVYSFKDSAGGIQRIHYAIDNLGVRANFHSSNVQFDPIIDSPDTFFGVRLNTKSEVGNSGNLESGSSEIYPFQNNQNWNDMGTKLSLNVPNLEQIRNEQLEYLPVDFKRKTIPEVKSSPINYLSSARPSNMDSRKFVQTKFSQEIPDKLEIVDAVQKPYYAFYEESAPVDFLQEKVFKESNQSPKSPRQFQSPNFQIYPKTTPASLITPQIFNPEMKHDSKALHFRNFTTPFLIKSNKGDALDESKLNYAANINEANIINSTDSSIPNLKTVFEKDASSNKSSKLAPISYITLVKSPLSAIFDTSNKNGQYYHYAMNLGETPGVSSQYVSKIYSTGDGLYKILNQTNIDVYKVENDIVIASDSATINSTHNEMPKDNRKYDDEISYSTINKAADISESNLSSNLENTEFKDSKNGKNRISNITNEFILLNNAKSSRIPEFDIFNESASQKQVYLTTSPSLEEITKSNEKNISTLNFFQDVSYSDSSVDNFIVPQYITTPSTFLNISTEFDTLNATNHTFYSSIKLLTEEHRNELQKSTTVLDFLIIHDNFETTTSLWNNEEPLEINNAFNFSTTSNVSLEQLTNESIDVSINQSHPDYKNISEISSDILQSTTPFFATENITGIMIETTTLLPDTFTPKLKESFSNSNQLKERKSRIIENNNTLNEYPAESNLNATTPPPPTATNFTVKYFEDSITHNASMLDSIEMNVTESSFENNTTETESNIMSPQIREMNISDLFEKNGSDEINKSLPNERYLEKPILELFLEDAEVEDVVSKLSSMPIIIKVTEPHNISLPIPSEIEEKNGGNATVIPNGNVNKTLNDNEANVLNTTEKLLTMEVIQE